MTTYAVWDPSEDPDAEFADEIEATSPGDATEIYARDDTDGTGEGCYCSPGVVLHVRDPEGNVLRFRVTMDFTPTYYAEPID